ncbi:MAG: acyltransferase [bacterium]|nr:acyltransferase [bacterium]
MRNFVLDLNTRSSTYLHSIDFLRGITALGVVVYHFLNHTDAHGHLLDSNNSVRTASQVLPSIVFIFFSLSGFVIAMSMHRNQFQLKSIGGFLARRWVRIEIPYIASILVYLGIAAAWSVKDGTGVSIDFQQVFHHLFYTIPFTDYAWYNDIYWTLALEFQFYLFIALAFPLFNANDWRLRYAALAAFSALGLLIPDNRLLFQYAPMFVVGIVLYYHLYSEKKSHTVAWVLIVLCLVQIGNSFDISASLFIAASLVLIPYSIERKNIFARIGKMGYSLYLIHGAAGGSLLYFLGKSDLSSGMKYLAVFGAILFSLGVSFLFYKLIELPSIKTASRITFGSKTSKSNEK